MPGNTSEMFKINPKTRVHCEPIRVRGQHLMRNPLVRPEYDSSVAERLDVGNDATVIDAAASPVGVEQPQLPAGL